MLRQQSFRPYPETHFAPAGEKRAASAQRTPRQNQLLAALPAVDYGRLLPHLEPVSLPLGCTVHEAGAQERYLYFLTAGVVSRFHLTRSGASAEFALTGNEGVIGIATFLGGDSTTSRAMVLSSGYAYRLGASQVRREFERGGPLVNLLLRYTQALIAQMMQTAACNRHHSIEQQLCRSILLCLDRSPSNELTMTHEQMADMLGVRREGVTEAAGHLQTAGLIRYSRGHIAVQDRPKLEKRTCECYSAVRREYYRLLPNFSNAKSFSGDALATLQL